MRTSEMCKLSDKKRRALRLGRKRRGYNTEPPRNHSPDEMLDYLRSHDIHTSRGLVAIRRKGDPTLWDFRKTFGSWNSAKDGAFGKPLPTKVDAEFALKAVTHFKLWTLEEYRSARRNMPDAVPSYHAVVRMWGSYGNLRAAAKQRSFRKTMESYIALWRRFGRKPTLGECNKNSVRVHDVLYFFKGKEQMDRFAASILTYYERGKRGPFPFSSIKS